MIDRFLTSVQRLIAAVIGIALLLGLLVGLVAWARSNPEALKELATQVVDAVVASVLWLGRLIADIVDGASAP